jgi:2-deoxy-D-gluconate 3-dehydrogenase
MKVTAETFVEQEKSDQSMLRLFDLTGKSALVTGATGGLGSALAEALREAGAQVGIVTRSESTSHLAKHRCVTIRGDLCRPGEPARVISEAVRHFGQLDILVNAHGIALRGASAEFALGDWQQTLEVNLTSVFATCQAAGRSFLEQKHGKIINIASMLSFSGGYCAAAYAASKGGIAQLTKALANEWAPHGINVNAIAPGYFSTPLTEPLRRDAVRNEQILSRLPAGRWGDPADLKGAVIFLASRASDYVHGILLPVDGGWLAR